MYSHFGKLSTWWYGMFMMPIDDDSFVDDNDYCCIGNS